MKTVRKLVFALLTVICAKGMAQMTFPIIERWHGGFRCAESKERMGKEVLHQALDVGDFAPLPRAVLRYRSYDSSPSRCFANPISFVETFFCDFIIYAFSVCYTDCH